MSADHVTILCKKVEEDASSLTRRYEKSVEKLEMASEIIPDNDEHQLLDLACLLSRLVQVKKDSEQSLQKLLFMTAFDIKYSGNNDLAKRLADSRALELLSLVRNNLGLLEALIIRADSAADDLHCQLELSNSSENELEPEAESAGFSNRNLSTVQNQETNLLHYTNMEMSTSFQEESLNAPTLINKNGVWIKTYNGIHLESSETRRATAFGRLKQDFDKQCINILILEKERNSLLHRADTLELEKLSMEARFSRLQTEVLELRKTIGKLRRKLAVDENKWNSRLEVAQLQVSELQAIQTGPQERLNSSVNLASSK